MDFDAVVQGRRSIRNFSTEKIPDEDIRLITHYGTLAPSAGGKQEWRCLAISNQLLKDELHKAANDKLLQLTKVKKSGGKTRSYAGIRDNMKLISEAPLLLAVFTQLYRSKVDEILQKSGYVDAEIDYLRMRPDLQTVGAVIQNMLLAAYMLGYGSCWLAGPNLARREIEYLLEITPPWALAALIALGRAVTKPGTKKVKPLNEMLTFIR